MDWSNEPYVRVYTRETDDDLALSWQAVALWDKLMRRFDRAGFIETRRGARGIAAISRIPLPVVELALPELLEDGRLVEVDGGFLAPNFIAAQEATKSDKQRQKDSRDRRRAQALDVTNRDGVVTQRDATVAERDSTVTSGHTPSRGVTLCSADPSVADPSPDLPPRAIPRVADTDLYAVARDTWAAVSEARVEVARELGFPNILPLPARFGMPSEPRGCRDLRDRVREEGSDAAATAAHVVKNLIAQAREEKSVEWLSEKAFTAGGWQTARNWTPGQSRKPPQRTSPRQGAIGAATPRADHGTQMRDPKEVM